MNVPVQTTAVMLFPKPETRDPRPETRDPKPETRNPKAPALAGLCSQQKARERFRNGVLNPKPRPYPQPSTLNPKPKP